MIDWSTCEAVERDSERVGGSWLFRGTRVPIASLFETAARNPHFRNPSTRTPPPRQP